MGNPEKNYTLVVGKGKGNSYGFPMGQLQLEINPFYATLTIRKIAKEIAKHCKMKNGEVKIISLNFVTYINKKGEIK